MCLGLVEPRPWRIFPHDELCSRPTCSSIAEADRVWAGEVSVPVSFRKFVPSRCHVSLGARLQETIDAPACRIQQVAEGPVG